MANILVANSSQLMSALSSASAGDTILLQSGNYGDVKLDGIDFSNYVTITSADGAQGATFDSIKVEDSSFIRLDGIHVDSPGDRAGIWVSGSDHIDILNSEINGPVNAPHPIDDVGFGIEIRDNSHNIRIEGNDVHHVLNGIANFGTRDFRIVENNVNYIGADAFKFAGVDEGLIKNNTGPTHFYPSDNAHADFMQFQGNPSSNLEIIGNVLLLENRFDMQGIFMGGTGGHNNLLIEENIIYTQMANGISVNEGVGSTITIRHNTLVNALSDVGPVTRINVTSDATIEYNIYTKKNGEMLDNNIVMQHLDPNNEFYYSDLFVNAHTSKGITLEDLIPVEGSLAETYGAVNRLNELLNGTSWEPEPVPEPEPTPEPEPVPEPEPTPEPEPAPTEEGSVYMRLGAHEIASAEDVLEFAPDKATELPAATIALTFNADTVSGTRGLLSKDAAGDGHHFTSYIKDGTLFVRFQGGATSQVFQIDGIEANVDYDFQVSFGNGEVFAILNGNVFGRAAFDTSWETNSEFLQIGANGWASGTGEAGFTHVFDGTISDMIFAGGIHSYEEIKQLLQEGQTPEPLPEPLPGPVGTEPVFSFNGSHEVSGRNTVLEYEHSQNLELSEATIALTFNADTVSGTRGLLSKDAIGYGGGGHFTSYIKNGTLFVRFQDGSDSQEFKVAGIQANVDYDLQVSFGNGEVLAILNGKIFGQTAFNTSWEGNSEFLQIGANGWASDSGEAGFRNVFDGTVSDVAIFDEALVLQEPEYYLG